MSRDRKVGVTGSRDGCTPKQLQSLCDLLRLMQSRDHISQLHHGDCVGADAQANRIANDLRIRTVAHPPKNPTLRAFCTSRECRTPRGYTERNHEIVDECGQLIVLPKEEKEIVRSGTWATCRYARSRGDVLVFIVWPDGTLLPQERKQCHS
jgi:hypothetical protein